jgi:uncharacterized damage-inducible protein DinB
MKMSAALLPEFDQEMATTRRVLERVPDDRLGWKPHDKSMSLGRLASHIAELPAWVDTILHQEGFDMAARENGYKPNDLGSNREILELFDSLLGKVRGTLESVEDQTLLQPWTLRRGDHVIFTLPRAAVLRTMVYSHIIHHRGQLSVYLRLNDVPLPSIYGPSADEAV